MDSTKNRKILLFPRTVKHENNDYLVTNICNLRYQFCYVSLKIKFEEESAVNIIDGNAFFNSKIEGIPKKNLIELKEGCVVIISPSNDQIEFKVDKYLL